MIFKHIHFETFLLDGDVVTNQLWEAIDKMNSEEYQGFVRMQAAPLVLSFNRAYGDIERHFDIRDGFMIISAWSNNQVDITRALMAVPIDRIFR